MVPGMWIVVVVGFASICVAIDSQGRRGGPEETALAFR